MMIERGADVNRLDGYGVTPLHVATQYGNVAMMRLLVSQGADVTKRDRDGDTALDLAGRDNLEGPKRCLQELALAKKNAD
jgi:ankyrin repeat protein